MKWGIGSYSLPWHIGIGDLRPAEPLDHLGLLEIAIEEGAQAVQFCENLPLIRLGQSDQDSLISRAREHAIQVEVGTRGLDAEELGLCCDVAERAGSPFVRAVVDRPGDEPSPDELALRLKGLAPLFRTRGIKLAIENHDRLPAGVLVEVIQQAGEDWLGICFDTANSLGCLEGPHEGLEMLLPFIVNLHLKDVVAVRESHMLGFRVMGAPVGEGSARLYKIARRTAEAHPHIHAIAEHWLPPLATIQETLVMEREWTRRSCSALRSWFGGRSA